jgi:hypothetical protein
MNKLIKPLWGIGVVWAQQAGRAFASATNPVEIVGQWGALGAFLCESFVYGEDGKQG